MTDITIDKLRALEAKRYAWKLPEPGADIMSPVALWRQPKKLYDGVDVPYVDAPEGEVLVRAFIGHYNLLLKDIGIWPSERARLLNQHPESLELRTAIIAASRERDAKEGFETKEPTAMLDRIVREMATE